MNERSGEPPETDGDDEAAVADERPRQSADTGSGRGHATSSRRVLGQSQQPSRRRVLGLAATLGIGGIAGCLGEDDREVHMVFRSWEGERRNTNRRASILAYEGEILHITVDDRRDVPFETIVAIYEPGEDGYVESRSIGQVGGFDDRPPETFYEVQTDGRHEFNVSPQTGDVDPSRVWIRIEPIEEIPDEATTDDHGPG